MTSFKEKLISEVLEHQDETGAKANLCILNFKGRREFPTLEDSIDYLITELDGKFPGNLDVGIVETDGVLAYYLVVTDLPADEPSDSKITFLGEQLTMNDFLRRKSR